MMSALSSALGGQASLDPYGAEGAGELVPVWVAQRGRLDDREPSWRCPVCRRGADEHELADPPAEQLESAWMCSGVKAKKSMTTSNSLPGRASRIDCGSRASATSVCAPEGDGAQAGRAAVEQGHVEALRDGLLGARGADHPRAADEEHSEGGHKDTPITSAPGATSLPRTTRRRRAATCVLRGDLAGWAGKALPVFSFGEMLTDVRHDLPSGTVTFLFTDIAGSTRLLHDLGAEAFAAALAEHRRVLRRAFDAHGGVEVDTQGDAFFVAFPTARGALDAAREALAELAGGLIQVRMGIHTGTPHMGDEGYVGVDVHRAARIAAAGHGGQVLVSAASVALLGTDGLRDLGLHRLKDLTAPERMHQLGAGDFPPLKSLHRTNLPVASTPFVGRQRELAEVLALFGEQYGRVLTLTGPGGSGKTRLGLQAAAAAAERFPDGIFWVSMAALRDPELVLDTMANALGARDGLVDHIGDGSVLIVLDNLEHLVHAAEQFPDLLARCPHLQLLVTSRELLRIPGEQAYLVAPLELGDAVQLFLARARAVVPGFVTSEGVADLCMRLENLPLALELAAARLRVMSPHQLVGRLSKRLDLLKAGPGVDARQQTLRATIDWSHDLLTEDEQRLFARLAVFAGGFSLEAAEAVCDADLDTLQSLFDKSLLGQRAGERFSMLETIREFSAERLEAFGEWARLRDNHAEYFLQLVEVAEPGLRAYDKRHFDQVEVEHGNVRAALDWLESSGQTVPALRMAAMVADFWGARGHYREGRRRLDRLLSIDIQPTAARAKALNAGCDTALSSGDLSLAKRRAQEALELHQAFGDMLGAAYSEFMLADIAAEEGDWAKGRRLFADSARLLDELGDEHQAMLAVRLLAWMHIELGDHGRARGLLEDNLTRARAARDEHIQGHTLEALASIATRENRLSDAISLIKGAYDLNREDPFRVAVCVARFAEVLARGGGVASAARLLACSEALLEDAGDRPPWVPTMMADTRATIAASLDEVALAEAEELGRRLTPDEAVRFALDHVPRGAAISADKPDG